jgi:hypothetical protein
MSEELVGWRDEDWLSAARFINHLRLPSGIGKTGSKAAFHQGKPGF